MVIIRTRNKITDFLMILAWASPFNVEYHISYLNEHYRKPVKMMQLTVTSLRDMPSRYLIKEHTFNEVIDYVEGNMGHVAVLTMADLTLLCNKWQESLGYTYHMTRERSYPQNPWYHGCRPYRFQNDVCSWCTRKRGSWRSQENVKQILSNVIVIFIYSSNNIEWPP